jgi:hypothetical protein
MYTTTQQTERKISYEDFRSLSLDEQKRYKTEILEDMRDYHSTLISNLGINRNDFNMKMAFFDKSGRHVVGIFASEFKKENGFYFEIITRDFQPDNANRTVYKIPNNPSFEEEYEMNEKGSYLVPLEELRVVNAVSVAISGPSAILEKSNVTAKNVTAYKAPAPMEDAPYSDMTIRDFMAIHTGKAISTKNWLNDLIKSIK